MSNGAIEGEEEIETKVKETSSLFDTILPAESSAVGMLLTCISNGVQKLTSDAWLLLLL